jgi:hypothetical protein
MSINLFSLHCATKSLAYSSLNQSLFEVLTYSDMMSHTIHCALHHTQFCNTAGLDSYGLISGGLSYLTHGFKGTGLYPYPVGGTGLVGWGTVLSQSTHAPHYAQRSSMTLEHLIATTQLSQ